MFGDGGQQKWEVLRRRLRFSLVQLDGDWGRSLRGKTLEGGTYLLHLSTLLCMCDSPILRTILLCKCLRVAVCKGVGLGNDRMAGVSFLPIRDPALSPGKRLRGWHQSPPPAE